MAQDNNSNTKGQQGQQQKTSNDRGMNESRGTDDMDESSLETGKVGGEGLPGNVDERTDSSTGAGSAGGPAGDIGGGGGVQLPEGGIGEPVHPDPGTTSVDSASHGNVSGS